MRWLSKIAAVALQELIVFPSFPSGNLGCMTEGSGVGREEGKGEGRGWMGGGGVLTEENNFASWGWSCWPNPVQCSNCILTPGKDIWGHLEEGAGLVLRPGNLSS